MDRRTFIAMLGSSAIVQLAEAQQAKVCRVGIILGGGPFYALIDGLKDGLRDLGFAEGKQYVLEIRDLKGDRKSAEEAARDLARAKVDLIYVIANSLAIAAKRATTDIPIVFAVGSDPVATGLVESFAKPGGRLTGVHYVVGDLTAKRLEILKATLPGLRSVVTFYDPGNADAIAGVQSTRAAARKLNIDCSSANVSVRPNSRRSTGRRKHPQSSHPPACVKPQLMRGMV